MSRRRMEAPFFSIIVAVYNVAPYLRRCVGSILVQPVKNYEAILVDDGSTDGSGAICDAFADKSGQVSVIHKENGGLSAARNAGIRKAAGTYILFVDGDDYIAADSLEKIQKCIQESGMPDVVFLQGRKICTKGRAGAPAASLEGGKIFRKGRAGAPAASLEGGKVYRRGRAGIPAALPKGGKAFRRGRAHAPMECGISSVVCGLGQDEIRAYIAGLPKFPASACTKAVRRRMFSDGTLYFRENLLCEDLEWSPRLFLRMASAGYCGSDYYCYRQGRQGSISNTASEKKAADVLSIVEGWNRYARKTEDEQERYMICSLMEYAFRHLLLNYSSVSRAHRRAYRRRVKKNAWILHTRRDAASRLIAYSYRFAGICLTGKIMKIYLRYRDGNGTVTERRYHRFYGKEDIINYHPDVSG